MGENRTGKRTTLVGDLHIGPSLPVGERSRPSSGAELDEVGDRSPAVLAQPAVGAVVATAGTSTYW